MVAAITAALTLATGLASTSVMPATAWADDTTVADTGIDAKPLIHYSFDSELGSTTIANEGTAPNSDGTLNTAAAVSDGSVKLTGSQFITVPTAAIQGRKDLTVSMWLRNDFGNGNTAAAYIGNADTKNGYWLFNPANPQGYFKSAVTTATAANPNNTPYSTEVGPARTPAPTTGAKATTGMALYTTVFDGNNSTLTVYRDGEQVGDTTTIPDGALTNYGDLVAYIGKSAYGVDPYDKITLDDYAVYGEALDADDVKAMFAAQATKDRASALGVPTQTVAARFTVPSTSAGAKVTWKSDNAAIAIDGENANVTRPAAGEQDAKVTLTADLEYPDGTKGQKKFIVTVLAQQKGPIAADAYKPEVKENDKQVTFNDPTDGNKQKTITIKHPALFTNKDYLDAMRDGVRNGEEAWVQAYNSFAGYEYARKGARVFYSTCFQNVPGPWSTGAALCGLPEFSEVTKRLQWDGDTAMRQAMMWYITGDNDYRARALGIVRAWANVKSTAGGYDFRSGPGLFGITVAAEILRATDPNPNQVPTVSADQDLVWSDADTAKMNNAVTMYSYLFTSEDWRRYMNQDQFCNVGRLAKAIWLDDGAAYADVVQRAIRGNDNYWNNGSIYNLMHWMTGNEITGEEIPEDQQHAQLMEMGRDAGHAQVDVGGTSTLAQSIYVQGTKVDPETGVISTAANAVNPFDFQDDRLMHGIAYFVKYHLGIAVPWTTMKADGGYWISRNNFGDNNITPYLGIVYNYYKYVKKADMTKGDLAIIAYAMETHFPEYTETGASGRNFPGTGNLLAAPAAAFGQGSPRNTFTGTPTLEIASTGSDSVKLTWDGVTGTTQDPRYVVLMSQDNNTWQIVNNPDLLTDSYEAKNLNPNKQYYWKVRVAGTNTESNVATIAPADMGKTSSSAAAKMNADGLVLRYTFDDLTSTDNGATVKDASGNGYDGTIRTAKTGRVETTDSADAKLGKAITLDGDNGNDPSYIDMPGNLANKLDEMTVSTWVKLPSNGNGGYRTGNYTSLFSFTAADGVNHPANVGQAGEYLEMEPARIKLLNRNDANGKTEQSFAINEKVDTDQWANLTVTIAKDGTTYVYLNGKQVSTSKDNLGADLKDADGNATTADHVTFNGTQRDMFQAVNAWIGRSVWGNGYLRGSVDDFRIYGKALTADQVKAIVDGNDLSSAATLTKLAFKGTDVSLADAISANGAVVNVDDLSKVNASDAAATAANAGDVITYALKGNLLTVGVKSKDGKAAHTYTIRLVDGSATAGPVLEYTFDKDNAIYGGGKVTNTGSAGTAFDGTIVNNGGSLASADGSTDKRLVLNGGNHGAGTRVTIPSGLVVDGEQDLTISADYLWDGANGCVYPFALGKDTNNYLVNIVSCGGNTRVEANKAGAKTQLTGTTPARQSWHTATVVVKGGKSISYYLDGTLVKTAQTTLTAADFAGTADASGYLGYSFYNDKDFGGQLDNVRVWRRALTDDELPKAADAIKLTGLTVGAKPTKTEYAIGDKLDTAGLKATATFSNGDVQTLDASSFTFDGFDSSALVAKQTVTAKLNMDPTRTFTFDVAVTGKPITGVAITGVPADGVLLDGTVQLGATVTPDDTTDAKDVTWTSSNTGAATVDATGKVTAKGIGETIITAKTANGVAAATTLLIGSKDLVYYIDAGTGANGTATIASASYDKISALAALKGKLLNSVSDQLSTDESTWGLVDAEGTDFTRRNTGKEIHNTGWYAVNDTLTYRLPLKKGTYTVSSESTRWGGANRVITPSVSWTDKAGTTHTVTGTDAVLDSNDHVYATAATTFTLDTDATVTYTLTKAAGSDATPTIDLLTVASVAPVAVTSVTAAIERDGKPTTALKVGQTAQASATVAPDNATDRVVTWASSDTKVATVDAGTGAITAVGPGKAEITATAGGKKSAAVALTVAAPVTGIAVTADRTDLTEGGKTAKASATVAPADASDKTVAWSSSNRHVVTVSADGTVTPVGAGKASVIATAQDGSGVFGAVDVTVAAKPASFAESLVEYLPFNGDATDRTANKLDGTVVGDGSSYVDGGVRGQALNLTGKQHVSLGTSEKLQPENLTLSFWLKPNGDMGNGEQLVAWAKGSYDSDGWYLVTTKDKALQLSVGPADSGKQPYMVQADMARADFFKAGEWTHVVVTYDAATKDVAFYRDGVKVASSVKYAAGANGATGVLGSTSVEKGIGWNGSQYKADSLNAAIDEWRVYSLPVTADQAKALYDQETGAPVLEYTFDGDTAVGANGTVANTGTAGASLNGTIAKDGATLTDHAGNGKALKLNGGNHGTAATVTIPSGLIASDQKDLTVSADYLWDGAASCVYPWALGQNNANYLVNIVSCGGGSTPTRVEAKKNNGAAVVAGGSTPAKDTWVHVDAIVKGGESISYYLDGKLIATTKTTLTAADFIGTTGDAGASGYLGLSFYGSDKDFGGQLDNVRVWNRALSDDEITPAPSSDASLKSLTVGDATVSLDDAASADGASLEVADPASVAVDDVKATVNDAAAHADVTVADGVVTVTVTAADGTAKVYKVTLVKAPVPVKSVTVSLDKTELTVGGTAQASAKVDPADADDAGKVEFASSDDSVAKVDAKTGVVTAVAAGTAEITATAGGVKSAAVTVTVKQPTFEESLIEHLSFDGNANDSTANKLDGTIVGDGSSYVEGVSGKADSALSLTGKQHVSLGTSTKLQPENLTLSFWLKPNAAPAGTGEQLIAWAKGAYNSDGWYLTSTGNNALALSVGPATGQPYLVQTDAKWADLFKVGEWSHVVVAYDAASKAVTFYKDGVKVASSVKYAIGQGGATGVLGSTDVEKGIGWNGSQYKVDSLNAALDEWRVYSLAASADQAKSLYEQDKPAPADTTAPVFDGVKDVVLEYGAAFDAKAGVTASDDRDGDVTAKIVVTGLVDTKKAGDYTLTYTVSDKAGNKATATRKVTVKEQPDTTKPVISGATDVTVEYGAKFDAKAGVTASDDRDGDLTGSIKVEGTVDTNKAGDYTLTYTVSDKAGNTASVTRKVTVKEQPVQPDTTKPVISGATDVTLEFGAKFDQLAGVTASDDRNGDLTAAIKVEGTVDTSKAGEYTLTYTVSDKAGNTASVTRKVTVKEQPDTTKPVISGATDVTVEYGAKFDAKAGVTASDDKDGDLTAAIKVEGTVDTSKAGEYTLTYTVSDKAGNETKVTRKVTVKEQPVQPEPSKRLVFTDVVSDTPHASDIQWLGDSGVSTGWKTGETDTEVTAVFSPMGPVVRQDMAAFLYRLAGKPAFDETKAVNPFTDVTPATPHYKEILWLASTGIAKGFRQADGSYQFGGERAVVRQDMAAFLKNLARVQGADPALGEGVDFTDVDASTPHAEEIAWLAQTGVTTGWKNPDGKTAEFRGMNVVVRQDMAAFLHRMSTNVLGK